MSNTITDFVVGLGFDSSEFERGMKASEKSLDGFKSDLLQLGVALGSAFSVHQLTFGFSKQAEEVRQFAQYLGVASDKYYALEQSAKSYGVQAGELQGLLGHIAQDRAAMAKGQFNYEDLAITGINWGAIHNAKDDVEAFVALAKQWQGLSKSQRINTANYYGLSPQVIDVLSKGEKASRELMSVYAKARPISEEMEKASRRFNASWALLEARLGGFSDRLAVPVTNTLSEIVEWLSAVADANQDALNSGIDELGEHIDVIAVAVGASAFSKTAGFLGWLGALVGMSNKALAALSKISGVFNVIGASALGAYAYIEVMKEKGENLDLDGDGKISKKERDSALSRYFDSENEGSIVQSINRDSPTANDYAIDTLESMKPKRNEPRDKMGVNNESRQDRNTNVTIINQIDSTPIGEMMLTFNRNGLESAVQLATGTTDR